VTSVFVGNYHGLPLEMKGERNTEIICVITPSGGGIIWGLW
jgi:hypothetical protein